MGCRARSVKGFVWIEVSGSMMGSVLDMTVGESSVGAAFSGNTTASSDETIRSCGSGFSTGEVDSPASLDETIRSGGSCFPWTLLAITTSMLRLGCEAGRAMHDEFAVDPSGLRWQSGQRAVYLSKVTKDQRTANDAFFLCETKYLPWHCLLAYSNPQPSLERSWLRTSIF